ncbi:hypothetical protein NM3141_2205 [Neisseria meningitidis NM3141]|nr:hypothetical protein NM3141_2205 [Neisseria meningitidis NM3141]
MFGKVAGRDAASRPACLRLVFPPVWPESGCVSETHTFAVLRASACDFRCDQPLAHQRLQRLVHCLHTARLPGLQDGVNLRDFVFADEVADGGVGNQDFVRGDTAVAVVRFQQVLGDDGGQRFGQHRAHHFFFSRREYVHNTVDGFCCAGRVQRAENQVSGFGGGQCQADGFWVAHLADKDNVGVFAQCGTQRVGEAEGVLVQLALVNQGFFALVDEFNRVFDGQDVCRLGFVDVVDHRGKRGRFARTGRAGNQNHAARRFCDFLENARGFQFFQR